MQKLPDKELISKIRQNDSLAFRQLFDRHYRLLLGTAINFLKEIDLAKDMVQDVFYQIWKNRSKLDFHSSVEAYLKRAVINRCLTQIKRKKPFVDSEELVEKPGNDANALDELALQDLEEALEAGLNSLPERCRTVFVMKRLEGMSQKEIAEALSISTKTVENQMTKAVKVLKEALKRFRQKKE